MGAAIIAAAFATDYIVFRFAFDTDYVGWYVAKGAVLAIALSAFSIVTDLDDDPDLIAADPGIYTASWLSYFGIGFMWLSGVISKARTRTRWEALDGAITGALAIGWTVVAFGWLLVVIPMLYLVTLVCGAPIRRTRATPATTVLEITKRDGTRRANIGANILKKPVTATNAIAAASLYGLSFVV